MQCSVPSMTREQQWCFKTD